MRINLIIIINLYLLLVLSCEKFPPGNTSSEAENNPPNTTLANIPREGATLYALVNFNWDGEDDDWVDRHMLYDKKEKKGV